MLVTLKNDFNISWIWAWIAIYKQKLLWSIPVLLCENETACLCCSACAAAGGNWESGTSTCTFVVENTCTAAGGTWEGCTGTTDSACTTAGGAWVSGTCTITAANACNTAGGFLIVVLIVFLIKKIL